ncbi:MAG: ribonuclease III [Spirochaetaceae bacterium]|jgi:ribonuclease-3|nr:ribonuclease III [Spirochaetaceae bacterium]
MKFDSFPEIDAKRKALLVSFQKSVKIKFKNILLLNLAFVHRSCSNESDVHCNNERLEFLGDSVLGLVTVSLLYSNLPDKSEGDLAKIKSIVVSADTLSNIARELQLDNMILLGRGEELSGGREKKTLLADALEAFFGAYYLDSGYHAAFKLIKRYIEPEIERVRNKKGYQDYKSLLQEASQQHWKIYPVYRQVKCTGPEHDRYFWIEVVINGKVFGPGMGKNKKTAEQEAARMAIEELQIAV